MKLKAPTPTPNLQPILTLDLIKTSCVFLPVWKPEARQRSGAVSSLFTGAFHLEDN